MSGWLVPAVTFLTVGLAGGYFIRWFQMARRVHERRLRRRWLQKARRGAWSPVPNSDDRVVWHASPAAPARPAGPRRVRQRRAVFSRERYIDGGG